MSSYLNQFKDLFLFIKKKHNNLILASQSVGVSHHLDIPFQILNNRPKIRTDIIECISESKAPSPKGAGKS